MSRPSIEQSREIDASLEAIYTILRDYRSEHPKILPKPYFKSIEVMEGGVGAGTVVRVQMEVMGAKQNLVLRVTEPEPGRALQEEDLQAGITTTFRLSPLEGGKRTLVRIITEWTPRSGLAGVVERLVNPAVTRTIYKKELALLAKYVEKGRRL
jgi:hypothetical protein